MAPGTRTALAAALVLSAALAAVGSGTASRPLPPLALKRQIDWSTLPSLQKGLPPWGNDSATLSKRLPRLGLDALAQEALAFHIHQHLDVYVDGSHVTVPAFVGIHVNGQSFQGTFITELHTHMPDGILHVESARVLRYQLGQFFGEWGVRLTSKCLGSFKGSCDNLHWWVNGKARGGDPAALVLKSHQEIVITVGKLPARVPKKYNFPPGY
jgi:hypothetical protein